MDAARAHIPLRALALCTLLFCAPGWAGETVNETRFAAPVRIRAGEAFLGEGRLYPSPVLHDADGDGRADVVVADLLGRVTFAPRSGERTSVALGAEAKLLDRDGKPLKFHNW